MSLYASGLERPDMTGHRIIRPEDIEWKPQPALPHGAEISMIFGDPEEPGEYLFRLRVPPGIRVMPHSHPEDRTYTVVSGTFYIGFGDSFDEKGLYKLLPGSIVLIPADVVHFQYSDRDSYLLQVEGKGPSAVMYTNPGDDPRHNQ